MLIFDPLVQWRNHGILGAGIGLMYRKMYLGVSGDNPVSPVLTVTPYHYVSLYGYVPEVSQYFNTCKYLSCRALGDTSSSAAWRSVRIAFSSPDDRMILARASRAASASAAMTL